MEAAAVWTVRTEVFDGPLDLLLHLVEREGIDLKNLRIARIADAYLEYLDRMRETHLGVAGEYLVLAATLVWMKSLELLPRPPTPLDEQGGPAEDPREALAKRLLELQRYREAAARLDARLVLGRDVFDRAAEPVEAEARPAATPIDAFGLLDLYWKMLQRERSQPVYEIGRSGPDLESCCRRVLAALGGPGGRTLLDDVLAALPRASDRILTFLAVLEMARLRWVDLAQDEHLGPVRLLCHVELGVDLAPLTGRMSEAT